MDLRMSAHKFRELSTGSIGGSTLSGTLAVGIGQGVGVARSAWAIGWCIPEECDTLSMYFSLGIETYCETVVQPIMVLNSSPYTLVYAILMKLVDTLLTTAKIGRYFRSAS